MQREGVVGIMPTPANAPARLGSQFSCRLRAVFQAVLCDQWFAAREAPTAVGQKQGLLATADQGHLNPLLRLLPAGAVVKAFRLDAAVEIPVEPMQKIASAAETPAASS